MHRNTLVAASDGEWHHICLSWESSLGSWKFYKDGGLTDEDTNLKKGHTITQGGTLAFGQEQDSVGGDFNISQSFQGKLSGIHVWDHVLTSIKIKEMSTTCLLNEEEDGNVYNWIGILREGEIRLVEPFTCEPIEKGMRVFNISPDNYNNIMESHKLSARSIFHQIVQRQNMPESSREYCF